MIQLFKKIRGKLLVEKRLGNYLAYAIGEVLLVVVGIVLAIQFSNWNDKRNEVKKEIWYLDNIANDMFYQKEGLEMLKTDFEETLETANNLLLTYNKTRNYTAIDSLSKKLNSLMITYSYPNTDNTYRELLSSGQVALIENDSLITNIIDFYLNTSEIDFIFKTNENQVFYGQVYSVLLKYSEVDISYYTDQEDLLMVDEEIQNYINNLLNAPANKLELTNAIKNKIMIVSDYLSTVNESIDDVDRMIAEIDKEIDLLKN
ncbi:MAG: DUF6090 family protein [Polaribacter sp.]|uniref:DUF6090 family protein n=1 Tax=Polaribacter sp. TaxID=1920175 RepID=UPI003BB0EF6D